MAKKNVRTSAETEQMGYIIYHPKRDCTKIGNKNVYHDGFDRNEDPYIWSDQFLHSFCHITQFSPQIGDFIFWCSGSSSRDFQTLSCDCVFLVKEKIYWKDANKIWRNCGIVDNDDAFQYHYQWVTQHPFKRRRRFTLKADAAKSFQPQNSDKQLIDILPFLKTQKILRNTLINAISKNRNGNWAIGTRPYKLDPQIAQALYGFLAKAAIKIKGSQLNGKHPKVEGSTPARCSKKCK